MTLLVQEFLRTHSIAHLATTHAVKARIVGHKASFNYDQIEARESDALAQQCRGLVLRTVDGSLMREDVPVETVVMARAFDRFFNYGQGAAASIDLAKGAAYEKLDGTLCIVHFDDVQSRWHVATRSVCEADLPAGWAGITFRGLFERALWVTTGATFDQWTRELSPEHTYLFELCTPENVVVVSHSDYTVTLLGVRETITGRELWPEDVDIGVPSAPSFRFASTDELIAFVRDRDPLKHEGLVWCEEVSPGVFARVKFKSAAYLAYSRIKDSCSSPRNLMSLIVSEKLDDALVVMPDPIKAEALRLQEGLRGALSRHASAYELITPEGEHGSKDHRKAFALAARESSGLWFEPAMAQYSGKCRDAHDFIAQKRGPDGGHSPSFLDGLIAMSGEVAS